MSNWTLRERGLGMAVVVLGVAAVVMPAWADSDDGGDVERAPVPGVTDRGGHVVPFLHTLSDEERQGMEETVECMREHGVKMPPPPEGEERPFAIPLPPPGADDEGFKEAAEACGLPEPPKLEARRGLIGECPPPPLPRSSEG